MVEPISPRLASASTSTPAGCRPAVVAPTPETRSTVHLEERHLRLDDGETLVGLHADLAERGESWR